MRDARALSRDDDLKPLGRVRLELQPGNGQQPVLLENPLLSWTLHRDLRHPRHARGEQLDRVVPLVVQRRTDLCVIPDPDDSV